MSFIEELEQSNGAAMAFAAALETAAGGELILGVSRPKRVMPVPEHFPQGAVRVVSSDLTSGFEGAVHIVITEELATTYERLAPDEIMLTSMVPVFEAGTIAMRNLAPVPLTFANIEETSIEEVTARNGVDYVVHTLVDGLDIVATLIFAIGDALIDADEPAGGMAAPMAGQMMSSGATAHQFQQLQEGMISLVEPRALALLHDVEMGVTAELGRRRMTVRDLLSLTPGAVIELDRAAGSPVDVLVNGTLIARGEVVVIDEEFGIRVSEIVATADLAL